MTHVAANVPIDPADTVTIPRQKLDRLMANYQMLLDEKKQMEADISILMFVGRKLMSIFSGSSIGSIVSAATKIMRNPTAHKAEFHELEMLYTKYQHLMPADGSPARALTAGHTLSDGV